MLRFGAKHVSVVLSCMLIISTPAFSQYSYNTGLKPDVTFGEHNDRFDMSSLVDYQNQYFRANTKNYRRSHSSRKQRRYDNPKDVAFAKLALRSDRERKKLEKKFKRETESQINSLANEILLRMASMRRNYGDDFALHDNMESNDDDVYDFNENLGRFQRGPSRRSGNPGDKTNGIGYRKIGTDPDMFNYAFPVDMKIKGYLVAPEDS